MQSNLLKPRIIEVEHLGPGHAKVVMEPFERGYATRWVMRCAAFCFHPWLAMRPLK
jgi:hypothetical protein